MPSRFGGRKVVEVRETTVEFSRLHCQPARQLQGQTKPPLVFWWASWRHKKSGVVGDSVMLSQNFLRPCNQVSFSQILRLKTGLLIGLLAFKTRFKPTLKNTDCGICCRWFSVQYIQKNMKNTKTCPQICLSRVDCCGDMLATPAVTGRTNTYQFCWSQNVRNFWTARVASDKGANTIDLTSWNAEYFNVLDGSGYQRTTGPKLCHTCHTWI